MKIQFYLRMVVLGLLCIELCTCTYQSNINNKPDENHKFEGYLLEVKEWKPKLEVKMEKYQNCFRVSWPMMIILLNLVGLSTVGYFFQFMNAVGQMATLFGNFFYLAILFRAVFVTGTYNENLIEEFDKRFDSASSFHWYQNLTSRIGSNELKLSLKNFFQEKKYSNKSRKILKKDLQSHLSQFDVDDTTAQEILDIFWPQSKEIKWIYYLIPGGINSIGNMFFFTVFVVNFFILLTIMQSQNKGIGDYE